MSDALTVLDVLKRLFPQRTSHAPPYWQWHRRLRAPRGRYANLGSYAFPPLVPFDAFAAVAHLLDLSGGYHHIAAELDGSQDQKRPFRGVVVSPDAVAECRHLAAIWRADPEIDDAHVSEEELEGLFETALVGKLISLRRLIRRWRQLLGDFGDEPVFVGQKPEQPAPQWWAIAHEILMIADEACVNVGFTHFPDTGPPPDVDVPWFELYVAVAMNQLAAENQTLPPDRRGFKSLSSADYDVACVLPKSRTTPVGCTLRSLSHHIALMPPRGVARGRWTRPQPGTLQRDDKELNLLLVPFPYSIEDQAFRPVHSRSHPTHGWGYFEVSQTWLGPRDTQSQREALVDRMSLFVTELALAAKASGAQSIDGIVFPELALDYWLYEALAFRLKRRLEGLELFVSGLSRDRAGRAGNFVGVWTFPKTLEPLDSEEDDGELSRGTVRDQITPPVTREKHHRWKLDRSQLAAYRLDGALNPKLQWWEDIHLLSRRVDFTAFRGKSVLAAMICEDLARVDPCQSLLRSVGPNLVIALLMDAPQRLDRWPSRYATILAEDPGCAVLTFTSRALMTRQHLMRVHPSTEPSDRIVGLWKDDFHGRSEPIHCPIDCQAVWLKLWSSGVTDFTLDGRDDKHGSTWVYGKHVPIAIDSAHARYPDVMGEADAMAHRLQR